MLKHPSYYTCMCLLSKWSWLLNVQNAIINKEQQKNNLVEAVAALVDSFTCTIATAWSSEDDDFSSTEVTAGGGADVGDDACKRNNIKNYYHP